MTTSEQDELALLIGDHRREVGQDPASLDYGYEYCDCGSNAVPWNQHLAQVLTDAGYSRAVTE
jgi:hypothetical protein